MKLECTIGSISCNGVLAEKGDIFEIDDVSGKHLLKHGNAVEIISEVSMVLKSNDSVQAVDRWNGAKWDDLKNTEQEQPKKTAKRKGRRKK